MSKSKKNCSSIHSIFYRMEMLLRNFNNGYRGTFCHIADADYIRIYPLTAICLFYGLLFYKTSNMKLKEHSSDMVELITIVFKNKSFDELSDDDCKHERLVPFGIANKYDLIEYILRDMDISYCNI